MALINKRLVKIPADQHINSIVTNLFYFFAIPSSLLVAFIIKTQYTIKIVLTITRPKINTILFILPHFKSFFIDSSPLDEFTLIEELSLKHSCINARVWHQAKLFSQVLTSPHEINHHGLLVQFDIFSQHGIIVITRHDIEKK